MLPASEFDHHASFSIVHGLYACVPHQFSSLSLTECMHIYSLIISLMSSCSSACVFDVRFRGLNQKALRCMKHMRQQTRVLVQACVLRARWGEWKSPKSGCYARAVQYSTCAMHICACMRVCAYASGLAADLSDALSSTSARRASSSREWTTEASSLFSSSRITSSLSSQRSMSSSTSD